MTYMNMKALELSLVWKHLKNDQGSRDFLIADMWGVIALLVTALLVNVMASPLLDHILVIGGVLALPIVFSRAVFIVRIRYANRITGDKFHDISKPKTEILHGFLVWFEYFINSILGIGIVFVIGGMLYAAVGRLIGFDRDAVDFILGIVEIGIGMAVCGLLNMWLISLIEKQKPFLKKKRLNDQWIWKTHVMQAVREVAADV